MTKRYLFPLLAAVAASATAAPRTSQQARAIAQEALSRYVKAEVSLSELPLRAAQRGAEADQLTPYYLFSDTQQRGFVLVSGSDLMPEVLGYGDQTLASLTDEQLPEALRGWLQYVADIEAYLEQHPDQAYLLEHAQATTTEVSQLVTSSWGQDAPFNDQCPEMDNGKNAVTGCMATSISQLINYYEYPAQFEGTYSYIDDNKTRSIDFSDFTIDYNLLRDDYSRKQGTTEERAEVAHLMMGVGHALNMSYGSLSGTITEMAVRGLNKNLGHAKAQSLMRKHYTLDEWNEVIQYELTNQRPIVFDGHSSTGGHSFIVDGVRSDGYYHVNWGWDNLGNGYYALTGVDPLHPSSQGTGGSIVDEGFRYQQDCITGVRPAVNGSRLVPNFFLEGPRGYTTIDSNRNEADHFDVDDFGMLYVPDGMIYSASNDKMTVCLGVKFVDCETQVAHYAIVFDEESDDIDILNGFRGYGFRTLEIPDGQYSVYPVVRAASDREWTDVYLPIGTVAPKVIIGDYTPAPTASDAELACSAFTLNKANTAGRDVSAEVANVLNVSADNSAFWGDLAIGVFDKSGNLAEVLSNGKYTLDEKNKLEHYKYFTDAISLTGTVPTTLADGDYFLSPVAFQQGSASWTRFGTFDVNAMTYDMTQYRNIAMTVKNGKVQIDGASPDPADSYAVYISDDVVINGNSLTLPISLQNAAPLCGFQFDITLPTGVSIHKTNNKEDVMLSTQRTTAAKTDVFDFEKQSSNTMRVVACSTEGTAFSGNDGEVLLVKLNVTTTAQRSGFTVKISNIVLTDNKAKAYKLPNYEKEINKIPVGIDEVVANGHANTEVYQLNGVRSNRSTNSGVTIIKNGNVVRKELK